MPTYTENFSALIKEKTDAELKEIFLNQENYHPDLILLAEQELADRHVDITSLIGLRLSRKEEKLHQLDTGKKGSPLYMASCFLLALLGGLLGIIAGYIYAFSTTKDEDGNKYYVYDAQTRSFGKIICGVGVAMLIYIIYVKSS